MITDTYGNNATNVYVYRNYFHDLNTNIQLGTEGLYFYYNIIDNIDGCPYESGVGSGLNISGYAAGTAPQNMKIWNNVIGNCADYGITISQYTGREIKYNNEFKNNIIFNCTDEELRIYNDPLIPTGVYDNIYQNNLLYDVGTLDVVAYWSVAMTVAEFEALSGTHGDDMGFNIGDNPDFDGATFELLVTSPAINTGANTGVLEDYAGTVVPQGIYYDIGAYEFEAFPIATTGLGWEEVLSKRNFKDDVNIAAGFSVDGVPIVFSGGAPVNIPGLTASASELNILDGATVTTAEVNYSDGVTSNIQTQISSKADTSLSNLGGAGIAVISDIVGDSLAARMGEGTTATTVGLSFLTLPNPTAIRFPQILADNSVTALTSSAFTTAIGASSIYSAAGDTSNYNTPNKVGDIFIDTSAGKVYISVTNQRNGWRILNFIIVLAYFKKKRKWKQSQS
jgi:hypothetical protein